MMEVDLGPCCACGKEDETVRNVYLINKRAPVPSTGWGCVVCGLPPDGASAVLCDACHEANADIKYAIVGYPAEKRRIPISDAPTEAFEHRLEFHRDEIVGPMTGLGWTA
jgi:hypothetical protein